MLQFYGERGMSARRCAQRGFSLLEVLFSLFLLSWALLGMFSIEMNLFQKSRGDIYFQQAVMLIENMAVYLRQHQGDATSYLREWREQINATLPNGDGRVVTLKHRASIIISWGKMKTPCKKNQSGLSGCVTLDINE